MPHIWISHRSLAKFWASVGLYDGHEKHGDSDDCLTQLLNDDCLTQLLEGFRLYAKVGWH